jgi:carboxylate-amine ligase
MGSKRPWGLFERYGIELEYMICDKQTLSVLPITDKLMWKLTGAFSNEVNAGEISYSNELALHVVELKTTEPMPSLYGLDKSFQHHIERINALLAEEGACLLPTGMHPWMDPDSVKLWQHEQNLVYENYHRIFDCRGHGWANIQSVHLNLPFSNDEEFCALHSAIRWLLPIMPALSASSPIKDGKISGYLDARLEVYRHNQKRIPSIAGCVVPEAIASRQEYLDKILKPMWKDIEEHDPDGLLAEEWLNSRGAIARFDRDAIEIRVLDTQECPRMDIAIVSAIVFVLRQFVQRIRAKQVLYSSIETEELASIFLKVIRDGEKTVISHPGYLQLFGQSSPMYAGDLWKHILRPFIESNECPDEMKESLRIILEQGPLARRILDQWGPNKEQQQSVYRALSESIATGQPFLQVSVNSNDTVLV